MSTPANMSPDPSSGPVPAPQPSGSPTEAEIRALAAQLQAMARTSPPLTLDQGTVVDVSLDGTPPTCSITLAGSSTQIDGVRYMNSYTPVITDTVVVLRQNGSPLVIGHTADVGTATASGGGWVAATLTGVSYRRVMDAGVWKVQFMGHGNATSTSLFTLPVLYRPSVQRITNIAFTANAASRLIVNTDGTVVVQQALLNTDAEGGVNQTSDPAPTGGSSDPNYVTGSLPGHSHTMGHRHWLNAHYHGMLLNMSSNIWFDGLEVFL